MIRAPLLVTVCGLLALVLAACGGDDGEESRTPEEIATFGAQLQQTAEAAATAGLGTPVPATPLPGGPALEIGDSATVGALEVTVNGFRTDTGSEELAPAPGSVWAIVEVTVFNSDSVPYTVAPLLQAAILDQDGVEYSPSLGPDLVGELGGAINANSSLTGEVGFEVPADAGLEFHFRDLTGPESARWRVR